MATDPAGGQTAAEVVPHQRRQVHELPPEVRPLVREHRALHARCPACGLVSVGVFPPEAPSRAQDGPRMRALAVYLVEQQHLPLGRAQQLLADLLGMRLARGTLVAWVQQAARLLGPVEAQIKAALYRKRQKRDQHWINMARWLDEERGHHGPNNRESTRPGTL